MTDPDARLASRTVTEGRVSRPDRSGLVAQVCLTHDVFGGIKGAAGLRQTKYRGRERVGCSFALATAADNLIRLPRLLAGASA